MSMIFENRFKDKVMIVTGATSGIGKATAIRAALEGAKVVLVGRRELLGLEIVKEIKNRGGEATFLTLDLSTEEAAKKLVEETINTYGKLDIVINNAGVMGTPCPVHELEKEDMDKVMDINLYSLLFCCKHEILQFMKQNSGGVIINNASVAGLTGVPGLPAYNASKHAVNGLTKNLAIDYSKYNIRINSVNPATTETPLVETNAKAYLEKIKEAKAQGIDPSAIASFVGVKRETLFKKPATSEEQAASILFLASDDASHMTGATVATDGGWTAF